MNDEKVCFNPGLTLAWMFFIASLLTVVSDFIHNDFGGLWAPALYGLLSLVYLARYYRARIRARTQR